MPYHLLSDVMHWRVRAAEFRLLAATIAGAEPKKAMLRMAAHYDQLSKSARERMAGAGHPFQPAVPGHPFQPAVPSHPFQPAVSDHPFQPAVPDHPFQPAVPVHPFQPADQAPTIEVQGEA